MLLLAFGCRSGKRAETFRLWREREPAVVDVEYAENTARFEDTAYLRECTLRELEMLEEQAGVDEVVRVIRQR